MGLEKLKSIFSDIKKFNRSDLTEIHSQKSVQIGTQEVDTMINKDASGYTANQINQSPTTLYRGIEGESPNLVFFGDRFDGTIYYQNSDYGPFPGPMDNWENYHAKGFTLNQVHKSPSQFVGIGGESPDMVFDESNTLMYSVGNRLVDFQKITSMWTNPLTGLTFPEGFTKNMKESELAKGFYGEGASDFQNTNFYSGIGWGGDGVKFQGSSYSFDNGLPVGNQEEWDIPSNFTYQDSIHTTNTIASTFGGPVDFMNGNNSYYNTVNPDVSPSGIPGFTNNFKTGGYTFGEGQKGNSKFLNDDDTIISTGTHTGYHDNGINFEGNTYSFDNGMPASSDETWTNLETYYDSIHSTNIISQTFGDTVDFMDGLSKHPDSTVEGSTFKIPGFTKDYKPGLFGGWSGDTPYGDSKLLTMWAREEEGKPIKTSMYTGYLGKVDNSTTEFPGPIGAHGSSLTLNQGDVSFPGGYSSDDTLGSSNFLERGTDTHTVFGYGGSDGFLGNLVFDSVNLFDSDKTTIQSGTSDVKVTKGSNKGGQLSKQFDVLYNNDHTAKEDKFLGPVQAGSNISNIERFNINSNLWVNNSDRVGDSANIGFFRIAVENVSGFGIFQSGLKEAMASGTNTEPYVSFNIGDTKQKWVDQFFPLSSVQLDVQRVGKFLSSQKGENFIANQNLLGTFQTYKTLYDPGSTMLNIASPKEGTPLNSMYNFTRDTGALGSLIDLVVPTTYSEWLDARALGKNPLGMVKMDQRTYAERESTHKPLAFATGDAMNNAANWIANQVLGDPSSPSPNDIAGINKDSGIDSKLNQQNSMGTNAPLGTWGKGDIMTLIHPLNDGEVPVPNPEDSTEGMPFYFKDLMDNKTIYFRAYVDGVSDSISPSWSSQNYIGRSEPVYTYTSSERELGFNLKLFAQTKDELNMIYTKINRLTSLCYPEYKSGETVTYLDTDGETEKSIVAGKIGDKLRMKPPLTKFRLGELFGSKNGEVNGFIKSLNYTFPDESPWEIKAGHRVPKYVQVAFTYQVIHSEVPSLDFARIVNTAGKTNTNSFYGINNTLGVEMEK